MNKKVLISIASLLILYANDFCRADEKLLTIEPAILSLIDQSEIAARDAGQLMEIKVKEGESVTAGQQLAMLDDREARAALSKAVADYEIAKKQARSNIKLDYAKAMLLVSEAELKRSNEADEKFKKSVSQTELEQLRLVVEKNKLEIQQAQEDIELAVLNASLKEREIDIIKSRLEKRLVIAPFDGSVVQIKKHVGEWVQPGDTVVRLIRTDRLRVEGFVSIKKLTGEILGSKSKFYVEIPGRGLQKIDAKVTFVSPEVNAINGQVRVRAEIENKDGKLRAGQNGKLELVLPNDDDQK